MGDSVLLFFGFIVSGFQCLKGFGARGLQVVLGAPCFFLCLLSCFCRRVLLSLCVRLKMRREARALASDGNEGFP